MEGTWMLILLVLVMLVGSYVAGSIPLNVSMSEDKLKKVTVFGAGLLVGTALAVIIPEGVRALFSERSSPTVGSNTAEPIDHDDDLHSVIGISLVLGFVFMLLVDQMSSRYNDASNPVEKNVTATVGLVVHAAADGIALGAAATTSHADVELIVFLAIMLHKAPAAFGLVTFLLHAGLERNRIRKHLLIFSFAAPALALLTYFGIGDQNKQTLSDVNATARMEKELYNLKSVCTPKAVYYNYSFITSNKIVLLLLTLLTHSTPAYLADLVCLLLGKERRFVKLSNKLYNMTIALSYFCLNDFLFVDDNLEGLYNSLSTTDKTIFNFDLTQIEWSEYVKIWAIGVRKYLIKDGLKNTDYAVRKQFWLRILHYILSTVYFYCLWKLVSVVFYCISTVFLLLTSQFCS